MLENSGAWSEIANPSADISAMFPLDSDVSREGIGPGTTGFPSASCRAASYATWQIEQIKELKGKYTSMLVIHCYLSVLDTLANS